MDGISTNEQPTSSNQLCEEKWKKLLHYYGQNTASLAGTVFTPKRNNRTQGYVQGCPFTKLKQLNPTSRDHIAWILKTHENWTPTQLTATGKPVVDETVLKDIGSVTALLFLKCLDITKKLGMISEGVNAWQKLVTTCNQDTSPLFCCYQHIQMCTQKTKPRTSTIR